MASTVRFLSVPIFFSTLMAFTIFNISTTLVQQAVTPKFKLSAFHIWDVPCSTYELSKYLSCHAERPALLFLVSNFQFFGLSSHRKSLLKPRDPTNLPPTRLHQQSPIYDLRESLQDISNNKQESLSHSSNTHRLHDHHRRILGFTPCHPLPQNDSNHVTCATTPGTLIKNSANAYRPSPHSPLRPWQYDETTILLIAALTTFCRLR